MAYVLYDAAYTKLKKSLSLLTMLLAFHRQICSLECWFDSWGKLVISILGSLECVALEFELINYYFGEFED